MSIGPLQIFLIILLVVLLFGTKKLGNVGSDLGKAIRGFKKGLNDDEDEETADKAQPEARLRADDDEPAAGDKTARQARERNDS